MTRSLAISWSAGRAVLIAGAAALTAVAALAHASTVRAQAPVAQTKIEARKMNIQEVTSPGGIKAWLVEDHNVPLMALRFSFNGGSAQNPEGKEGTANFLTAMLDEGAGDLESKEFQERVEDIAMQMSFEDTQDYFYGSFTTLSVNRDKALDLLRLAITVPRFDADAVQRIRAQLVTSLAYAEKNPSRVAGRKWSELAFPNHPYGRPSQGTRESIAKLSAVDLEAYRKRVFARDGLKLVAVGDIDAKGLGLLLDKVFGELPAKGELLPVPAVTMQRGIQHVVEMNVPQSVAKFGTPGLLRDDPDFIPAFIMNQVLGGGGFASRLMEEVREKRGLAYSVYSYLQPLDQAGLFIGGVATKNEEIGQSLDVIRSELARMAKDGPTETELANAKSFLTGSYALRFDTSSKIADQLLGIQIGDLGIDYVNRRNGLIEATSIDDIKRVAARILKVEDLLVTVVGKPKDLKTNAASKPSPRG